MMDLYVIRHGNTPSNTKGTMNGRLDEDISELGIEQAKAAAPEIMKLPIDLILCSPMKRTRHTMELINGNNVPVIFDDRLMERDAGGYTGKALTAMDRARYWNWYTGEDNGAETVQEICARLRDALDEYREKYAGKTLLLVTHNGVSRAIYAYFNGIPADGNMRSAGSVKNCEVSKYSWEH